MLENGRSQYNELPKSAQTPNLFKLRQNILLSTVHIYRWHKRSWTIQEAFEKPLVFQVFHFFRFRNVFTSYKYHIQNQHTKLHRMMYYLLTFQIKKFLTKSQGKGPPQGFFIQKFFFWISLFFHQQLFLKSRKQDFCGETEILT